MKNSSQAEFDVHAEGYDGGMDNRLKALAGDSADDFVAVKVRWLLHQWPDLRTDATLSILDYGCGVATLLRLLRAAGVQGQLTGTDVSAGMLREAARIWPSGERPRLQAQIGANTRLERDQFDIIIISAVLHHVPIQERDEVYAELRRLSRPDGRLVVFEHNPWNPVTRFVVARTPIDADAVLLSAPEVVGALAANEWRDIRTSHLMFLPPRLGGAAAMADRLLGWLPAGGQYAVTARK
jgi:SAM-dependent methyltransferase